MRRGTLSSRLAGALRSLPAALRGSSAQLRRASGTSCGASRSRHQSRSSSSGRAAARGTTKAVTASPHSGRAGRPPRPRRPRGARAARPRLSSGATFSPPVTIRSLMRPSSCSGRRRRGGRGRPCGASRRRRARPARPSARARGSRRRRRDPQLHAGERPSRAAGHDLRGGLGHPVDGRDRDARPRPPTRAAPAGSARRRAAIARRPGVALEPGVAQAHEHRRHERDERDLARLERVAHAVGVEAVVQHGGGARGSRSGRAPTARRRVERQRAEPAVAGRRRRDASAEAAGARLEVREAQRHRLGLAGGARRCRITSAPPRRIERRRAPPRRASSGDRRPRRARQVAWSRRGELDAGASGRAGTTAPGLERRRPGGPRARRAAA